MEDNIHKKKKKKKKKSKKNKKKNNKKTKKFANSSLGVYQPDSNHEMLLLILDFIITTGTSL